MTSRAAGAAPLFQDLETSLRREYPELARPLASPAAPVQKVPANDSADAHVRARVTEVRREAAVVAWFNPTKLVEAGDGAQKERILSALVTDCDVRPSSDRARWCLRREVRRLVLSELAADPDVLAQVLRDTEALVADDDARLLRRVVQRGRIDPARLDGKERLSLLRVAEWTEGIFDNAPALQQIRGLVARDAIKESLDVLVKRFQGRESELRRLRQFISRRPLRGNSLLPVLGVSGIGGVGKSALLSRFADTLLGRRGASRAAVVLIDFDRARFWSGDPVALTFEVTRQLAAWFPELAESLRKVRHSARVNLLSSAFSSGNQAVTTPDEATERSASELLSTLPRVLRNGGVATRERPLLIVLDTLEVLQAARSDDPESSGTRGPQAVADWLVNLAHSGNLRLRILIAGRAPIGEDPTFSSLLTEPELRLLGLDRTAAAALLREDGVRTRDAERLLDALANDVDETYNPLIIRLAARLVKTGIVRPELLMRDVRRGRKNLDQELVQGMLYRRILAHIGGRGGDETLGKLAHPGLVLRRVTPGVIEQVLLPVVAPKQRGKVDAVELFNRLRREVWLVREVDKDTVEHRTDLRRTMLRLIDIDMREQARKIHRAGIKYYRKDAAGATPSPESAGEAFYHTLMLTTRAQAAKLKAADVRQHESSLLPNMDDLPPHVRTVVKSLLDRPLTDKEGLALPEPQRTEFIERQGERHLQNDEPSRALALLKGTKDQHPWWELQALATLGEWETAKDRGLLNRPRPDAAHWRLDLVRVFDHFNLLAWICLCLGDATTAHDHASNVLSSIGPQSNLPGLAPPLLEAAARGMTYRLLAERAAGRASTPPSLMWSGLREEELGATGVALEATRQAVLAGTQPGADCLLAFSGEALPPDVSFLAALKSVESPLLKRRLTRVQNALQKLPKRAHSGEILGTVARAFPKVVTVDPNLWPDMPEHWRLVCPNPEFRGPIKFALLEAFKTDRELRRLGDIGESLIERPPFDLQSKVFAETARRRRNPGPEIAKLVLFIDRLGRLGSLLRMARNEKSTAKLVMLDNGFGRWTSPFITLPITEAPSANLLRAASPP